MKCANIVLYNLSTNDDAEELKANRESLIRKYGTGRGQTCHKVDAGQNFPDLKGKGTVGVYVLSHTKDVKPPHLAQILVTQLEGTDVKRINIACCRGALPSHNLMKDLCTELVKAGKAAGDRSFLKEDLLVCGFTVNVTTFELGDEYTEGNLAQKFDNLDEVKAKGRQVGTVETDWDSKKLHIMHEQVGDAGSFTQEVEAWFRRMIPPIWGKHRATFVDGEQQLKNPKTVDGLVQPLKLSVDGLSKAAKQKAVTDKIKQLDWEPFFEACPDMARLFVAKVGWDKFLKKLSKQDSETAKIWKSLDEYTKKKKAMRFDGAKFAEVPLSQYTEKDDLKQALAFIESATKTKGGATKGKSEVSLQFLPTI